MISILTDVNVLAIGLACVLGFILGGVWYGVVIAKPYAVALGRQNLPPQKPTALYLLGPLGCNFIATITAAILIRALAIDTIPAAIEFGLVIGVGLIMSTVTNVAINPNVPRPFMYAALNAPYFLLYSVLMSVILVYFA